MTIKLAPGRRARPAAEGKGTAIRVGEDAKAIVLKHAIEMTVEQQRVVTVREAADDIIFWFQEMQKRGLYNKE